MIQEPLQDFIIGCADSIIAGQLTTKQLREALRNPRLQRVVMNADIKRLLIEACQSRQSCTTNVAALMLEVSAVDRRISQLVRQQQPQEERSIA